jgi:hypothetical protein
MFELCRLSYWTAIRNHPGNLLSGMCLKVLHNTSITGHFTFLDTFSGPIDFPAQDWPRSWNTRAMPQRNRKLTGCANYQLATVSCIASCIETNTLQQTRSQGDLGNVSRLLGEISKQQQVQGQASSEPTIDRVSAALEEAEAGTEKQEKLNIILVSSEVAR